jgi:hypothetical protein
VQRLQFGDAGRSIHGDDQASADDSLPPDVRCLAVCFDRQVYSMEIEFAYTRRRPEAVQQVTRFDATKLSSNGENSADGIAFADVARLPPAASFRPQHHLARRVALHPSAGQSRQGICSAR